MVRRGRSSRGGGMGGGINRRYLAQVMDSCGKDLTTAEDIVDDLRSRYSNFASLTRQKLLLNVRQVLNDRTSKRVKDNEEDENNGDEEGSAAQRKNQRRIEEKEEKLLQAEQSHLRRRNMERSPSSSSSKDNGDVSTSEGTIYNEKLSPQFDLINHTLRDNYAKLSSSKKLPVEKNVEVETVSNKGRSKMATLGARKEAKGSLSLSGTTVIGDLEVEGVIKDLLLKTGGIKNVLEELEMNVLFPILRTV